MYKVGYIDDDNSQYDNYKRKLINRHSDIELIYFDDCITKEDFVQKIYESKADVMLIDYKMANLYGFNGTTLISYINDCVRDVECFILTAVDQDDITDNLVAERNRFSKTVFDTEGNDEGRIKKLNDFINVIKDSANVFRVRREQKVDDFQKLNEKRNEEGLSLKEEEDYLNLYKVLSSYGMVEEIPEKLLGSQFNKQIDDIIKVGKEIINDKH